MKKVLLVSYGGGHIKIISLIAAALERSGEVDFKILALTTAYKVATACFPNKTVRLSDYVHLFDKHKIEIEGYGKSLLSENFNPNSGVSESETCWYLGLSMFDLVQRHGESHAYEQYQERKRQAFLPISVMTTILRNEQPDTIVSTTSPRFEQASLIAGNQLGIETIEILDLFGELYPLPEAKHIVCMNKSVSDSLKAQGLVDRHYYHYGQPAIEETCNYIKKIDKNSIKNRLNLNQKNVLLYATQRPIICNEDFSYAGFAGYDTINNHVFSILENLHKNFSIDILLRIHPNENIENYQPWLEKYKFVRCVNENLNIHESISVCNLLLNQASTVSVEAMAVGKTVFTFRYHLDQTYPLPEVAVDPFIHSNGFEELEKNLLDFLRKGLSTEQKIALDFLPISSVENIVRLINAV
ncbi:MAG: hypothetical protein ACWIPH_06605 [Ostreibacterium sp.]